MSAPIPLAYELQASRPRAVASRPRRRGHLLLLRCLCVRFQLAISDNNAGTVWGVRSNNIPTDGEWDKFWVGAIALTAVTFSVARLARPSSRLLSPGVAFGLLLLAAPLCAAAYLLWMIGTSASVGMVYKGGWPYMGAAALCLLVAIALFAFLGRTRR